MRIGENARIFFSEREKSVPAMRVTTLVNKLIGLQGLWVRGFHFQADKARVVVDVVPRRRKPLCGICGRKVRKNKDRYNRYWRHLDLFGVRTYLRYSIRRVVCRRCGVVREKVPWADKGSRFTKSFEQEVAWLAGCVPRFVEKERRPPLRHQSIISGGNFRVFENLAQTLVAVDAS